VVSNGAALTDELSMLPHDWEFVGHARIDDDVVAYVIVDVDLAGQDLAEATLSSPRRASVFIGNEAPVGPSKRRPCSFGTRSPSTTSQLRSWLCSNLRQPTVTGRWLRTPSSRCC
jgi:hypothetical protein